MRRALLVACALSLASCSGDGVDSADEAPASVSPSPSPSPSPTASPSPTLEPWDFCDNIRAFGSLRRAVRRGVDLPEEIIEKVERLQERLATYRDGLTDEDARGAIRDLAEATGKLQLSIAAAGADYPFDATVRLRAQTVSFVTLTAALRVGCEP